MADPTLAPPDIAWKDLLKSLAQQKCILLLGPDLLPGRYSTNNSFIVDTSPPVPPGLIGPANESRINARLKFTWSKIQDATRYQIEIDNNSDFSSPEWSSIRSDPSYQILTFRSGRYFWRVRAKDMAGNWSAWSLVNVVNIP